MAANKYPGLCKCGADVAALAGEVFKANGKWHVRCVDCAPQTAPAREMIGAIYWPNGMGYTECSEEYEAASHVLQDAQRDYEDARDEGVETSELYDAYHRASDALAVLQMAGGHMGARIRFDKPDVMSALLGGGSVVMKNGAMAVKQ